MHNTIHFNRGPENLVDELLNTAEHCYEQGNYSSAIYYYTQVLDLGVAQADLNYVLYMRGLAYRQCGKPEEAMADWQKVQDRGFRHPWGLDWMDLLK